MYQIKKQEMNLNTQRVNAIKMAEKEAHLRRLSMEQNFLDRLSQNVGLKKSAIDFQEREIDSEMKKL